MTALAGVRRRTLLQGGAALCAAPGFLRHAGAQAPRFGLGVASGQPRPDGVVLWTRLTGESLPDTVPVQWELADDERFSKVVARGEELAESAWAHSVHAEPRDLTPGRVYWYRFTALGDRSPPGRTRTAPATAAAASLSFAIASCQRYESGYYAAWRHLARDHELDLVLFLGDYIYEYGSPAQALRRTEGGLATTLAEYRARYATYKRDPDLQAAHASVPWVLVWDDHEVGNDYAGLQGQGLEPGFAAQRAAAYRAYWEHMPFSKSIRPRGADMRIFSRLDWGRLARIHLLDDRQYRDPQVCPRPDRGGSNTVSLEECPALKNPQRSLLGLDQERWLGEGWDTARAWNLLAQQTLMARFSWTDPARGPMYWTDGWDGYAPARNRLLGVVAERAVPGVVVLGGDVHANYVADLHADFDDPRSAVVATEFCGTSITSLSHSQARIDGARRHNPHIHYGRGDQRGYVRFRVDQTRLDAELRVLDDARDPASAMTSAARFTVDPKRPGAARS